MQWEVVIGLETHAQLTTASKIFSGASIRFGAAPNTQACPVDLALPGVLPVMNKGAVERAIQFGLAIGATIAPHSVFARKNYFYPDLPKGYQISQFELPVVVGGKVSFILEKDGKPELRTVQLTRAHLEEDAGKSLHEDYQGMTGIDLNRAGTPLLEIVTEPDMRSAAEAVAYAKALHSLVMWLGICDGNMQEGSFRCDANVSVRPVGQVEYGTRCEIKNLNSFRFMEDAINYELRRQIELIEDGGKVQQATRLYDPDKKETRSMRSKEDAQDYRYFPDPDLPPLVISSEWIDEVLERMDKIPGTNEVDLPENRARHYREKYGLSEYDASILTSDRYIAIYFDSLSQEATIRGNSTEMGEPSFQENDVSKYKLCANWTINEVLSKVNDDGVESSKLSPTIPPLGQILLNLRKNVINAKTSKDLFNEIWQDYKDNAFDSLPNWTPEKVDRVIDERGLKQISDSSALEAIIDEVLTANAKSVEEFRAGKEKAFNALIGQAMKATKGKGNPTQLTELLRKKLEG
ncbi:MAG: Asp-tRNA(Asn)/Glu-tRNA(Gln) amidotransferase subunit GatB [Pseudomonadota bacterium]